MAGSPFDQDFTPSAMPGQDAMRRMKVAVVGGGNGGECHPRARLRDRLVVALT